MRTSIATLLTLTLAGAANAQQAPSRPTPPRSPEGTEAMPAGATARCNDGSFVTGTPESDCASRGGILVRFPQRDVPPAGPALTPRAVTSPPTVETPIELPAPARPAAMAARTENVESAPAEGGARCRNGDLVTGAVGDACAGRGGIAIRYAPRSLPAGPSPASAVRPSTRVQRDAPPPAGATARCRDGSYSTQPVGDATCLGNGGIATVIPSDAPRPRPPLPTP